MARLFGLKFWIFCAVYLAAGIPTIQSILYEIFPKWESSLGGILSPSTLAKIVWILLAIFFYKPVWRSIWKLNFVGKWLSDKIFPDLNGEWEMEIHSNWPIINAMRIAAKDNTENRVDVLQEGTNFPDLAVTKLPAIIEQGWTKINVVVDKNNLTPLLHSQTISVELLKEELGFPKRVAWIFRQENSSTAQTDVQSFFGSAILNVSRDGNTLEGQYWNNRQWHKGLNVAGKVIMKRINQ